jgi:hypothetical protein
MEALPGNEGYYDPQRSMYLTFNSYRNWKERVDRNGLRLELGEWRLTDEQG